MDGAEGTVPSSFSARPVRRREPPEILNQVQDDRFYKFRMTGLFSLTSLSVSIYNNIISIIQEFIMESQNRENLGSRLGFLLLSAGCAIGLGNVWRFPYITGKYGGAAFVLIYLFFLVILGLPVMVL